MTTSLPPLPATCPGCSCGPAFLGIEQDVWYLWTATCTGLVQMRTGITSDPASVCNLDTVLAVYNTPCPAATSAPVTPLVCCDDSCGAGGTCDLASAVQLQVTCGQQYLIRVGRKPGTPGGAGTLKINCQGEPCPAGTPKACPNCCGAKPEFEDPIYATNFTGRVAVVTSSDIGFGGQFTNDPMVTVFNLDAAPQPPGVFPPNGFTWNPDGAANSSFRYGGIGGTQWDRSVLGTVFGLTLDDSGNIFVATSSSYTGAMIGGLGGSTPFSVYRLDSGTGVPTVFQNVPNVSLPAGPGLGNITFDCQEQVFYVSNFADGRIYRLSTSGTILGWYHHSSDLIDAGTAPEAGNPYTNFARLGERPWAVQVHDGRLYYSVWGQYATSGGFCPFATGPFSAIPNRVWSIALSGGNFVATTRQQELQTPVFPGTLTSPPVSDISFSPTCFMALAERQMSSDDGVCAHRSRVLEYQFGTSWTPTSNYNGGFGFPVGTIAFQGTNATGGVDYDMGTGGGITGGRIWATGDALGDAPIGTTCPPNEQLWAAYGLAGMITTGGATQSNTIWIDYNDDHCIPVGQLGFVDKMKLGDVEVACAEPPCLSVGNEKVFCPNDATGTGCYTYSFTVTNNTPFSIKYITVPLNPSSGPPITIQPNVINLLLQDGSLLDPGESTTVTLTICGGSPGDEFCIRIGLNTADFVECCFEDVCIELPECDCGQLRDQQIVEVQCSGKPPTVTFTFCFTMDNLSDEAFDQVIFIPGNTESAVFVKDFFFLPPLQPGGSIQLCVEVTGATPGDEFCFFVLLQHPGEDCCCGFEKCITVPPCPTVPVGACCFPAGGEFCQITTEADCTGTWQGPGTTCADSCGVIGIPGACCVPGAPCFLTISPAECEAVGGSFMGFGTTCNDCAAASFCVADLNTDGVIDGIDLGLLLSQWTDGIEYQPCPPNVSADTNSDCRIDGIDLGVMLNGWGPCKK